MIFLIFYVFMCYLLSIIAVFSSKNMPFIMMLIAPISVPITLGFIYSKALDDTFGGN